MVTVDIPAFCLAAGAPARVLDYFGPPADRPEGLPAAGGPSIWIHAVSVGEVLAARSLVRPLKARFPGHRVFVSTTTLTGNTIARETVRGADGVFFAPFDFPGPVDRVLDRLRPALLVLVETEIWPNLIHRARGRGARVAIVNGRISPRSFPRYRRLRPLLRHVLAEIDLFLMHQLGYDNLTLYDASMGEWARDPALPIETG